MAIRKSQAKIPAPKLCTEFVLQTLLYRVQEIRARCTKSRDELHRIPLVKAFHYVDAPFSEQVAIATLLSDMDTEIESIEAPRENPCDQARLDGATPDRPNPPAIADAAS
jgi:hypothetical protein